MTYALTPGMVGAAATIVAVGYAIARRHLSPATSVAVVCIKAAIPLVYFLQLYDRSWYFLDDFVYEQQGKAMIDAGYNPWSALATSKGRSLLAALSTGDHYLYGWWNLLAEWAFGEVYWAPVFLNVVATFAAGFATARMLEDQGFPPAYVRGFLVFFLLHIELLVWSSFVNLKDILILTMAAFALRSIVALARLRKERRARRWLSPSAVMHLSIIAVVIPSSYYVRFYVPLLIFATVAVWSVLGMRWRWRIAFFIAVPLVGLWIKRAFAWHLSFLDLSGAPWGLIRFSLTPRPWGTEPNYSFLILPAVVHWVLFIPAVIAGVALWISRPLARIPLIYLGIVMVLFAAVPEVQGPRHRVQVLPFIVWLQFHAIWWALSVSTRRSPRAAGHPNVPIQTVTATTR